MKRIVILSVVALIALSFVACNGDEVKKYKGTYDGTYTFVKDNTTKEGKVVVGVNSVKDNSILLYYCINLDNVVESSGVYESTSEDIDIIANILTAIGVDMGNTAEETIKNIKIKCSFSGDRLDMNISYAVDVLGMATLDIRAITFVGTKTK